MKTSLIRFPALAAAAAVVMAGCGGSGEARRGELSRIVVISKQLNEFVYDLGMEDHVIGRDLTSVWPPEITAKTSVGYHRALSADGIISLRPSLVLSDGNVGPDAVLEQVAKVGLRIVTLKPGNTVESAMALMQQLGDTFSVRPRADSIVAAWKAGMDSLYADTTAFAGAGKRPRVLFIHFGQINNDYLVLKSGGVADRMLRWAGGVNAVDSVGGMARLTPELVAKSQPDVIIATEVGFDRYGSAEKFLEVPGVALTPAGRSGRIYRITEQKIMYYGPRTPAAVREIAQMIHK